MFEASFTVRSGETITLHAWPYREFSANYADYLNLLAALKAGTQQAEADALQQSLLDRVMHASVRADDLELIGVPDVPGILEAIFDLNAVDEMAAKPLGLHMRVVQAVENAQQTTTVTIHSGQEAKTLTTSPTSPTS